MNTGLPRPELTGPDYFDVASTLAAIEAGRPVRFPVFEMVHWGGLSFCLNFEKDPIQRCLRRGEFFEADELSALKDFVNDGFHVIDIGSNIGNHALYFASRLNAARVVVVEPNPLALAPLVANVVVNNLVDVIDMTALGVGLSDHSAGGYFMGRHDRNLGATKMKPEGGDLQVHRGDDLFEGETPDLIKIDVEGMEMKVLAGLQDTIARTRPVILIEVDGENDAAFAQWCAAHGYDTRRTDRHSAKNCNYLVVPHGFTPGAGSPRAQDRIAQMGQARTKGQI